MNRLAYCMLQFSHLLLWIIKNLLYSQILSVLPLLHWSCTYVYLIFNISLKFSLLCNTQDSKIHNELPQYCFYSLFSVPQFTAYVLFVNLCLFSLHLNKVKYQLKMPLVSIAAVICYRQDQIRHKAYFTLRASAFSMLLANLLLNCKTFILCNTESILIVNSPENYTTLNIMSVVQINKIHLLKLE